MGDGFRSAEELTSFFHAHGGLHDVRLNQVSYDIDNETFVVSVDDLNANFADTEEYVGERRCELLFEKAEALKLDVENREGVCISEARILRSGSKWRLEIDLRLGAGSFGGRSIVVLFEALRIVDT